MQLTTRQHAVWPTTQTVRGLKCWGADPQLRWTFGVSYQRQQQQRQPLLRGANTTCKAAIGSAGSNAAAGVPQQQRQWRYPDFMPTQIAEVQEAAAHDMASAMRREAVEVAALRQTINTAFVGPDAWPTAPADAAAPPFLLVPSFDSSILEFRRLYPLLAAQRRAFAVDSVGWGFTDATYTADPTQPLGPLQKREHLHSFWRSKIGKPAVVVGTSLGGTAALDFALEHPEDVAALVLIDAQGFIDGIGPIAKLPRFAARWGVQILKTEQLRQQANLMAYYDPKTFATPDALRVGRLHTFLPGWADANVAFIQSGGYTGIGALVPTVKPPTLVLWGRHDRIIPPATAQQFADALPTATVQFLEESGHSGHLEQPQETADAIMQFLGRFDK